jgi:hypothetical protein
MELAAKITQATVIQERQYRATVGQRIRVWANAILDAAERFTHWADGRPNVMMGLGGEIRGPWDMVR